MILRYTDHAANERTFLAWIRTALAVIAFGAILARSDLFGHSAIRPHRMIADAGLACVAIGITLFLAGYRRFRTTRATIGGEDVSALRGGAMEAVLAIALTFVGMAFLTALVGLRAP